MLMRDREQMCSANKQCRKIEGALFRPLPVQCAPIGAALDGGAVCCVLCAVWGAVDGGAVGQFSVMPQMPSCAH